MVRSGHLAAAFVLVLASVAILAESKPAATLGDWLAKSIAEGKAGPSSAAPAYGYGDVEVLETCIQEYAINNCQQDSSPSYFDSELTCCRPKHHGPEALSPGESLLPTKTGECSFTQFGFSSNVKVSDTVNKIATFLATCQFDKKADECGHPFCDKLTLTVQGDVYGISDAIISSKPAPSTYLENCSARRRSTPWGQKHDDKKTKAVAKAAYDEEEPEYEPHYEPHYDHDHHERHYEHDHEPHYEPRYEGPYYEGPEYDYHHNTTLYKADAVVYYGAMTITSRVHGVKYEQGWFEYVNDYDQKGAIEITKEQAGDAYVLDPYKYKLSFYKDKSY